MTLQTIYDFVWDEKWWFPNKIFGKHYGWKDLENQPGSDTYYPQVGDLHWGILLGAGLVLLRFLLERLLIAPIGYKLGIQPKRPPYITPHPHLEAAYKQRRHQQDFDTLSKQTDWTVRQVEVWFRKRKKRDATPTIKKFCDSGWHFMFYTTSFIYGLCLLWNKPWFGTNTVECWIDWPKQHVSNGVYWYYMMELGFYCSLIFTLLSDHKRADFVQMMVHHFATIVLIYFSWISNLVRVGSLVLIVHDVSDPWLEIAKMGIYLKWKKFTDVSFGIFVLLWTVARHIYLPFVILYTTTIEVLDYIDEPTFVNYFFNFFLYLLLILTCIWSYYIYKEVYKTLTEGDVKDTRSDSEGEDNDILEEQNGVNNAKERSENGTVNAVENGNNFISNGNTCTLENGNTIKP